MKFNADKFKKLMALCLLIFFGVGLILGGNIFKNFQYIKEPQAVNLLVYSSFMSPEIVKEIEGETNLKINVDYADSIYEIEDKLKDPKAKYDLVSIYSFQALELDEEARLQPINWSLVKDQGNIATDFMSLGGDEIAKKLLPLSWGVNGFAYNPQKLSGKIDSWEDVLSKLSSKDQILLYDIPLSLYQLSILNSQVKTPGKASDKISDKAKSAQSEQNLESLLKNLLKFSKLYHMGSKTMPELKDFVLVEVSLGKKDPNLEQLKFAIPKEGGLFWTLSLAEPRFAPHPKEVATFLSAVVEKKIALSLVKFSHLATTNRLLNREEIDANLKAEYIRDIPMTSLKFQTSFNDEGLFSQLIEQSQNKR